MADKKISELPKLSSIQDSAMLVVEYNGTAYHLTGAQLKAYVASAGGGGGSGGGDMAKSVYDPDLAVATAGGIVGYVSNVVGGINTALDEINGEVV